MATKKSPRVKKVATTKKAAPKASKALMRSPAISLSTPEIASISFAVQTMIKAIQDSKISILGVLRAANRPITVEEIRVGLEQIGVELDAGSIKTHLLFLTDPEINLIRLVPNSNPLQCEAV